MKGHSLARRVALVGLVVEIQEQKGDVGFPRELDHNLKVENVSICISSQKNITTPNLASDNNTVIVDEFSESITGIPCEAAARPTANIARRYRPAAR